MSGSLPCFSHISASRDIDQHKTTLSAFLHRSINTLMPSNLMTLSLHPAFPTERPRPDPGGGADLLLVGHPVPAGIPAVRPRPPWQRPGPGGGGPDYLSGRPDEHGRHCDLQ